MKTATRANPLNLLILALLCVLAPARAQSVQWTPLQPSPRWEHAMAYDAARGVTVLFGGSGGGYNDETWEWNGTTWNQRAVPGPSPRAGHTMAYDAARGVTVLFGGYNGSAYNGETWEWN